VTNNRRHGWYPALAAYGLTVAQRTAWAKLRARFAAKVTRCVFCGVQFSALVRCQVDHRVPHRGDLRLLMDESNLQGLCPTCHSGTKRRMENGTARRPTGLDGYPIEKGD
jgi:5-methylcytosine-specific restriction endonuclease McrA